MRTYYLRIGTARYKFEAESEKKAIRNAKRIAGNRKIESLSYLEVTDNESERGGNEIFVTVEESDE